MYSLTERNTKLYVYFVKTERDRVQLNHERQVEL